MALNPDDFLALRAQSDQWEAFLAEERTNPWYFFPEHERWSVVKKRFRKQYCEQVKLGAAFNVGLFALILLLTQSVFVSLLALVFITHSFFNRATALWQKCLESCAVEVGDNAKFAYCKVIGSMYSYANLYQIDLTLLMTIVNSMVEVGDVVQIRTFVQENGFEAEYDLIRRIHLRTQTLYNLRSL